jgi:hypothetical protein
MPLLLPVVGYNLDFRSGPVPAILSVSPALDKVFNNGNGVFIKFVGILTAGILAELRPPGRYRLCYVRQVTGHGEHLFDRDTAIFGQFAAGSSAGSVLTR